MIAATAGAGQSIDLARPFRPSCPHRPANRSAVQIAMKHKFIAAVERLSGRDVLAFISNNHVGLDMEIELFKLKPNLNQTVESSSAST